MPLVPKHLLVAASAWFSKGVTAFALLATVKILTGSLNIDEYSVFVLLTSLTGWFLLLDFGVGVAVQNKISQLRAAGEDYQEIVKSGARAGFICLICTLAVLYLASPYAGPLLLKNIDSLDDHKKGMLFYMAGALMTCQGVGCIAYRVWYAQHRGHLSNILPAVASVTGLLGLMAAASIQTPLRLELSLIAFLAPTAMLAVVPMLAMLVSTEGHGKLHDHNQVLKESLNTIKSGRKFLLFALMSAGVLQIDYVVISQYLKPVDVTSYYIYTKIFSLGLFIYTAVLFSLWPVFSELIAKGNWIAVERYVKRYTLIGVIFMVVFSIFVIQFMSDAIALLAPNTPIAYDLNLILLLGAYSIVRVWTDTHAIVLQSIGEMSNFWIYVPIQAVISITLQIAAVSEYGIHGIIFALIASYVLTVAWALPVRVWRMANKS